MNRPSTLLPRTRLSALGRSLAGPAALLALAPEGVTRLARAFPETHR